MNVPFSPFVWTIHPPFPKSYTYLTHMHTHSYCNFLESSSCLHLLATAMAAVSGTVLLLAFHLQKPLFSSLPVHLFRWLSSTSFLKIFLNFDLVKLTPWLSSLTKTIFYFYFYFVDGKKREKKNKKVHFAEDVMEPSGNGEEFRKRLQSKSLYQNRNFSSNSKDGGGEKKISRDYEGIPANRMALYSGILRDRGVHRVSYCWIDFWTFSPSFFVNYLVSTPDLLW